jgi:hypothetical protein
MKYSIAGMTAYQINDFEWVAVPDGWTRQQIEEWHARETGLDRDEAGYYETFEPLTPETTLITDDTPDGEREKTTVRAVVEEYVSRNGVEAFLLACTEE